MRLEEGPTNLKSHHYVSSTSEDYILLIEPNTDGVDNGTYSFYWTFNPEPPVLNSLPPTDNDGNVSLTWISPVDLDINYYNIYRSNNPNIPIDVAHKISNPGAITGNSYNDTYLANGTYYYAITCMDNNEHESSPSNEVSTQVGDIVRPKSPLLHIPISYPIDNDGIILLNWSNINMDDILSCNLYRSETPNFQLNSSTFLKSILTSTTTYPDKVITNGNYYYKITAVDINQLESLPSNEVNTTYIDDIKPSKPSGLNFVIKNDEVLLEWDSNEDIDIDYYIIYKSEDKITSDNVNSLENLATLSDTSIIDDDIEEGKTYYYVIIAIDVNGLSSDLSQNLKVSIPEPNLFTSNEIMLIVILIFSLISILLAITAIVMYKKKNGIWIWENPSLKLKLQKFKSRFFLMRKTPKSIKKPKSKQLKKNKRLITQIEEAKELDMELTEEELDFLKKIKPSEKVKDSDLQEIWNLSKKDDEE